MRILDFLNGFRDHPSDGGVAFEYRLICSGELFNCSASPTDLPKSPYARLLCKSPFTLLAIPNHLSQYPQELALRFSAPSVTESHPSGTLIHHADADIARDIAALLSLLLRRLVTVATKVYERHPESDTLIPELFRDCPTPIVNSFNPVHWERKPLTFLHRVDEPTEVIDYNPRPLSVDPERLQSMLVGVASTAAAECVVTSARLYSLAMTQLENDADLAYRSLIEAVEATATEYSGFKATDDQLVRAKPNVAALAISLGLTEAQAHQLTMEACKGIPWSKKKFITFLVQNCTDDLWAADTLFPMPTEFTPTKDDFESVLGKIYDARGSSTHTGKGFPLSSTIGLGPRVSVRAFASVDWKKKPFPPVAWFERVVNNAFRSFIGRSIA
jgi:hypothetical protein